MAHNNNPPQLTPELESAVEDIWAYFTRWELKAPASFDLIVKELMVTRPAYGARLLESERQRVKQRILGANHEHPPGRYGIGSPESRWTAAKVVDDLFPELATDQAHERQP
jgi:hypothetical protein